MCSDFLLVEKTDALQEETRKLNAITSTSTGASAPTADGRVVCAKCPCYFKPSSCVTLDRLAQLHTTLVACHK